MGRSQESFNKKDVRNKKEKKRKEKEAKKLARKDGEKASFDDMIAYVDENGVITSEPIDPTSKTEIKLEDIAVSVPKSTAQDEIDPVKKGVVSFYNESKGFGFIKDLDTKQDVFVHANNVIGEIKEGNLVTYEVENGQRGPSAIRVQLSK
jgi:cold shock CspA family protein